MRNQPGGFKTCCWKMFAETPCSPIAHTSYWLSRLPKAQDAIRKRRGILSSPARHMARLVVKAAARRERVVDAAT